MELNKEENADHYVMQGEEKNEKSYEKKTITDLISYRAKFS